MSKNGLMDTWIDRLVSQHWTAAVSKTSRRRQLCNRGSEDSRIACDIAPCCGWSSTQPRSVQSRVSSYQSNNPVIHQSIQFPPC